MNVRSEYVSSVYFPYRTANRRKDRVPVQTKTTEEERSPSEGRKESAKTGSHY